MNKQTTTIVIVLAIIVLAVLAFMYMPKSAAGPEATSTTPTTTPAATGSKPAAVKSSVAASPLIATSKLIKVTGATVALYSGVNPSGDAVYTPVAGVDGTSFKALTQLMTVENPSLKDGTNAAIALGQGQVAYYSDKTYIYVFSVFTTSADTRVALERLDNADHATFKVTTSPWYSKDAKNVYGLEAPSSDGPYKSGSYEWKPYDSTVIANADAASFVIASGANYDAHDKAHTYRKGTVVGNYPQ